MLLLLFLPSGITFIGEDKNTLTPRKEFLLLCTYPIFLPFPCSCLPLIPCLSLCLPPSFNLELREIFHSSFDRCQIDNMSSFKLSCLGKTKFVQENSNLDDKCQDTPDGMTRETLIRHPAHVPGGLSVSLSPLFLFVHG